MWGHKLTSNAVKSVKYARCGYRDKQAEAYAAAIVYAKAMRDLGREIEIETSTVEGLQAITRLVIDGYSVIENGVYCYKNPALG